MASEQTTSLDGDWVVTQQWAGVKPYKFPMSIKNGVVTVEGGFNGVSDQLGSSSFVSLAIANYAQKSITSYIGNIAGGAMGGQMTGTQNSKVVQGIWSAVKSHLDNAVPGAFNVGA